MGRFGISVARTLFSLGHDVLGVDNDEEIIQNLSNELTHVVTADLLEESTYKALGLRNFDAGIVAVGDLEASMMCTLLLRECGVPFILAKASTALHGRMLDKIGADKVIYPERDMGIRVGHNLADSNIVDYIELVDDLSIIEIAPPTMMIGKSLIEAELRKLYNVNVVAIKRDGKTTVNPEPDDKIQAADIMVILGTRESVKALESSM
ncbi:MAG TPA: TrkA family potassium uptake protein [Candidatus Avacidaminococcus intestinavium]|uniref:TrkA family potassium uptake protein n=1 Tax=Candidatus Avacidaminococcus intestinavium TaxID=2840684 RepID=A0A9D1MQH8_9FIRM|nr:TrkA family potassium uptake protein [Candidatus Avacidaminococcus intestinavium]